jgi:3-oxoadipate enol-lactonase
VLALLDRAGVARAHFCSNAAVARWFTPDFIPRQPGAVAEVQVAMERTSAEGYVRCCAAVRDADFRETIVRIRTPLLLISGADDVATPPADGLYLAQRIAGSRSLTFDTAHLSNIESPHEFSEAVGSCCQTECAKS